MEEADPMQMRLLAAKAIAREAGTLARRRFLDASFKVGFKGPQDYLTEVDGETEELIVSRLERGLSLRTVSSARRRRAGRRAPAGRHGLSIRSTARRISPAASRTSACRSPALRQAGSKSA